MKETKIAVIYHSATGTTAQLAEAVMIGIDTIEKVSAAPFRILGSDIVHGRFKNLAALELAVSADAIIFGSPTFMGCVSAEFKAFADATSDLWSDQQWAGKVAAGFTVGSNLSGDQLNTIQYLQIFAAQHGMLWSGIDIHDGNDPMGRNRLGAQGGLIAHTVDSSIHDKDLRTAHYLGSRTGKIAKSLA